MNTFLPYADFDRSVKVLDNPRLGKQRVEVLQLCKAIKGQSKGWVNHPCTRMWRPHLAALLSYGKAICSEWTERGYEDSVLLSLMDFREFFVEPKMPPWFGSPRLHASHRANLLRKDRWYYGQFGWTEKPSDEYFWPLPWYAWKAHETLV